MLSYLFLFFHLDVHQSIKLSFFLLIYVQFSNSFNIGPEMGGEMNITAAIQVAQLALKHRQNKNQQQRIIVFAGR